jgi:PhnB protein
MAQINPYITFNGNCAEAFTFYNGVFGTESLQLMHYKDMPPAENCQEMPKEEGEKVMHACLKISDGYNLMGADGSEMFGHSTIIGNNISVSINTESREEADNLFNGLSNGGQVTMPMELTFWGAYFGMFIDKFGINWMVNFDEDPMK